MSDRIISGLPEKEWRRQWYRKYYAKNGERILKRQREYQEKNREHITEKRREYVARNAARVKKTNKRWYEKNKESVARRQRENQMRIRYSLSLLDIEKLLSEQGGGCAICASSSPGGRGTWRVDHDHKTNRVRGLLCNSCNLTLGHMKDDPIRIRKAAAYLEAAK